MGPELALFITHYGYIAVFSLIFAQELGVPNPVPNEAILLFAGSLAAIGTLSFPLIFLTAVAADFVGTSILYLFFFAFRKFISRRRLPKWFPIDMGRLQKLADLIARRDQWGIFLGRLIPYLRGYASVAAGFLEISPRIFVPVVFLSAVVWSGGYVLIGDLLGSRVEHFIGYFGGVQQVFVVIVIAFVLLFVGRHLYRHFKGNANGGPSQG